MEGKFENGDVECPICQMSFRHSQIDIHVNECLSRSLEPSEVDDSLKVSKKRKSNDTAWGCLKPQPSPVHNTKKPKVDFNRGQRIGTEMDSGKIKQDMYVECICPVGEMEESSNIAVHDGTPPQKSISQTRMPQTVGVLSEPNRRPPISACSNSRDSVTINISATSKPLADQMRPKTFENYVGQDKAVGRRSLLRSLLQSDQIPSLILWGPPGCGKTTLAKIIAQKCKAGCTLKFVQLSATTSGVNDVKEVIKVAKNDQRMLKKKTILFLDEIHRFNKTQQDSLLPHVEDGTIILIGATTENPSFQVNSALLSRCRVITLDKLEPSDLQLILTRAVVAVGGAVLEDGRDGGEETNSEKLVYIEKEAITTLSNLCDGDARAALNSLHMAVQSRLCQQDSQSQVSSTCQSNRRTVVTSTDVREGLQRSHVLYDRAGEEHYNCVSALHKSVRGSHATAALYWMARMLEGGENPLFVARRLVRIASEDIGLADPLALPQAVSTYQACHFIGMPECDVILAQCVVYLCRAPKSVEVYRAYNAAKEQVKGHQGTQPSVPLHLRNASTKLMKSLGYGKGYKYNPDFEGPVEQDYLPPELKNINFFT